MSNATRKIEDLQGMNVDTSQALGFVSKSNIEFSQGNYPKALEYATLALNSLEPPRQEQLFLNSSYTVFLLLIPLAVSIGFFIIRKYRRKFNSHMQSSSIKIDPLKSDTSTNMFKENNLIEKQSPIKEQTGNESSTDNSDLRNLVTGIIRQKRNLKPEEKEILFYISEKEGAAFEGEIRNKFILPKTSLWRLIKRLERENLIEVTKIGGQNLVKLKLSHQ
jgi:hypothetical protein